jgi:Na+-transporting NADH:ubiquinone oxidoreductase subunit NqrF
VDEATDIIDLEVKMIGGGGGGQCKQCRVNIGFVTNVEGKRRQ